MPETGGLTLSAVRWCAVPGDDLIWRELDGELVVRNARSGSTHLLGPLAAAVLTTLVEARAGISVPGLVALLRGDTDTRSESEWSSAVEAVLSEFRRLGLAEPEQP